MSSSPLWKHIKSTASSSHRTASTEYLSQRDDSPVIEFIPPKNITVEEILYHDVPKRHRFSYGPRLLKLELCLPGILQPHRRWSGAAVQSTCRRNWLNCVNRKARKQNQAKHKKLHCLDKQRRKSQSIQAIGRAIICSTRSERWIRGSILQQPRNGDLWYRASESRIQISILLNDVGQSQVQDSPLQDDNYTINNSSSSSTSSTAEKASLTVEDESDISCATTCPRYFYWDSGLLAHSISLKRSQLVTEKDRVLFYLSIDGARRNNPVWTKEEMNALSHSVSYTKLDQKTESLLPRTSSSVTDSHNQRSIEDTGDEYPRADENHRVVTFEVVLNRKPGQSLGLTLVEKSIPFSLDPSASQTGGKCSGIFIKHLTPGGLAEQSGQVRVNDQLLTINSVSVLAFHSASWQIGNHIQSGVLHSTSGHPNNQPEANTDQLYAIGCTNYKTNFTDMKSHLNTNETGGTLLYPFAVRLLRQAIGPIHLGLRRSITKSDSDTSCYANHVEEAVVDIGPENGKLLANTSERDDTEMPQSGFPAAENNVKHSSSSSADIASVPKKDQMPDNAPSPEHSLMSTRRSGSPTEIAHNPKSLVSALINDSDCALTQGKIVEINLPEPITVTKIPLGDSPTVTRKARITRIIDTKSVLSLSSINTTQSIEGPLQTKILLSDVRRSSPLATTGVPFSLKRNGDTIRIENKLPNKQKHSMVENSLTYQAKPLVVTPRPHPRHLYSSQTTISETPITPWTPKAKCRLSSNYPSTSRTRVTIGKRHSVCKRTDNLSRTKRPTLWPPSSGDHSHSHRVRHNNLGHMRCNSPHRRCKVSEQRGRHHVISRARHHCSVQSNKSTSRLDSRLAALAKHIPQNINYPASGYKLDMGTIDVDDSQQFQELIANLTENEWQALLHMISQPDETYHTPRMRIKHEKSPSMMMKRHQQECPKPDLWSRERVHADRDMECGDGYRKNVHRGIHANRQRHVE